MSARKKIRNALEFLKELTPNGVNGTVIAIDPQTKAIVGRGYVGGESLSRIAKFLDQHSTDNLYWTPNALSQVLNKKATKADVKAMRWVHLDYDNDPSDESLERIRAYPLPPTMIVRSGGGFNVYWLLATPVRANGNLAELEDANRRVINDFGADISTQNLDRILRLPFTTNYPTKTKLARGRTVVPATLVEYHPERTYTLDQFAPLTEPEKREWVRKEQKASEQKTLDRSRELMRKVGIDVRDGLGDEDIIANHSTTDPHALDQADPVRAVQRCIDKCRTPKRESEPVILLGFTMADILKPIREETYLLPGLIPTDAYTLIAGALSAYKTTLLHNLIVWRATGYDLLELGAVERSNDIGPCVLASYEDIDWRIAARLQRVLQSGHRNILRLHGRIAANEFLSRAEKNIRRIELSGRAGKTLVGREQQQIRPNDAFLEQLFIAVRAFTTNGVLMGIDPLRLAIVGSQNDDDGADVVVQVLNSISLELPGSGTVVASHTTKAGAQEPGTGYIGAAYSTSGSALYSQHARSNFLMSRLKVDDIAERFDAEQVPPNDAGRQVVAQLTHGRLSHGPETGESYFRMQNDGVLIRIHPRATLTPDQQREHVLPIVARAIDRLKAAGTKASKRALESDAIATGEMGTRVNLRAGIELLQVAGYLAFAGTTSNRVGVITPAGVAKLRELAQVGARGQKNG